MTVINKRTKYRIQATDKVNNMSAEFHNILLVLLAARKALKSGMNVAIKVVK